MKHAKREGSSTQAQQLRRRLSLRLAASWLIYTAVFATLMVVLNLTVVPRIADAVADSTSEWITWSYGDHSLQEYLDELGLQAIGACDSEEMAEYYVRVLNGEEPVDAVSYSEVQVDDGQGAVMATEATPLSPFAEDDAESVFAIMDSGLARVLSGDIDPDADMLVIDDPRGSASATSVRAVQEAALMQMVQRDMGVWNSNWQFVSNADGVQARDLSVYRMVKQLKYPLVLALYLAGCLVVIFLGYGRAMRYFDELSGAVAALLRDREKPIELSKPLSITQDELNAIRLSALADERVAQAAERRKDELVAYLAHDIKTPLTSVMGYLMLLSEAPDMDPGQRQRYIDTASRKSQRLEQLIDEFFEITRYNLQAIPIERANVEVRLLCEQVADEFYPEAHGRGLRIDVEAPRDQLAFIDPDKIARALGNVVRNAVAYADPDTRIAIAAQPFKRDDTPWWRITVANKGREISPAHLQSIFEKFYREDAARSSSSGRSGLGLAIAKEIVTAHGGTIAASSHQGQTVFTIELPR